MAMGNDVQGPEAHGLRRLVLDPQALPFEPRTSGRPEPLGKDTRTPESNDADTRPCEEQTGSHEKFLLSHSNIDRLTDEKWDALCINLHDAGTKACSINEHRCPSWRDLKSGLYAPWFNDCPASAGGSSCGGVGWMVHQSHAAEFSEWEEGPNDGAHLKWIKHGEKGVATHLGSLYVPCASICKDTRRNIVDSTLKTMVAMKDMPYIIMGDINLDVRHSDSEESLRWREALALSGAVIINHEGEWGGKPTRVPRGAQSGQAAHLDVIIVSQPAMRKMLPVMTAVGSGDDEIDGGQEVYRLNAGETYTDHKVMTCEVKAMSSLKEKPEQTWYLRWSLSKVEKDPMLKQLFGYEAEHRGVLRQLSEKLRNKQITPDEGHGAIAKELTEIAEVVIGSVWTTKKPPKCCLHSHKVNKAFRAMQNARKRLKRLKKARAGVDLILVAETEYRGKKSTFRRVSRAEANAKAQGRMDEAAKQGKTAVQKESAKAFKKMTSTASKAANRFECATLEYPAGAPREEASGEAEIGQLVSKATFTISKMDRDEEAFSRPFLEMVEETLEKAQDQAEYECEASMQHAPTVKETREAVVSLKSKLYKSAGPDMVTNWMLVWGGEPVIDVLQALFERAWNENSLPEQWCEATISYLYKGSGRKTEISNYRPISLISVIGKTFTRAWLPRLVAKVAPQLVQEQGCGRKGQGSMEQLWAFLDMTEESLEGKDEPNKEKGLYAMFADVHKAYDQVWRDGLYLTLYATGVRGNMWKIIQQWLNRANATTAWNGIRGPRVNLQQGLRQGCVLSPILYCAFVNMLMAEKPGALVPMGMRTEIKEFFGQGLQMVPQDDSECGVLNTALKRRVRCLLFMDDTTLLAKSKKGLETLIGAYQNFCSKFRMRLNVKKSQLMHFTKEDDDELEVVSKGVTFSTPKNPKRELLKERIRSLESEVEESLLAFYSGTAWLGAEYLAELWATSRTEISTLKAQVAELGCSKKFLGFRCDSKLGDAHLNAQVGRAKGELWKAKYISRRVGEAMAVEYIRGHVAPKILFGMELVRRKNAGTKMLQRWNALVSEAVLSGGLVDGKEFWEGQPNLRKQGLAAETKEAPWDIQLEKRKIEFLRKLVGLKPDSLAGAMVAARAAQGVYTRFIRLAVGLAASWGVVVGPCGGSKATQKRWKKALQQKAQRLAETRLADLARTWRSKCASQEEFMHGRGDGMMLATLNGRDEVTKWADLLPGQRATRVQLTRFKGGSFPGSTVAIGKRVRGSGDLKGSDLDDVLKCSCRKGRQTSMHLWLECEKTRTAREEMMAKANDIVGRQGDERERAQWAVKSAVERFQHVLSTRTVMRFHVEKAIRMGCLPRLMQTFAAVCAECAQENIRVKVDVTAILKARKS